MSTAEAPVNGAKKKPVMTFGPYSTGGGSTIEAAIWANEGKDENAGRVFYGVSFSRNYYNGKDAGGKDRYDKTQTLRQQDIPAVIYALTQCQEWIFEQRIADRKEDREDQEVQQDF